MTVAQIDPKTGNVIAYFRNRQEAAKAINRSHDAVGKAIRGTQELAGGYKWKEVAASVPRVAVPSDLAAKTQSRKKAAPGRAKEHTQILEAEEAEELEEVEEAEELEEVEEVEEAEELEEVEEVEEDEEEEEDVCETGARYVSRMAAHADAFAAKDDDNTTAANTNANTYVSASAAASSQPLAGSLATAAAKPTSGFAAFAPALPDTRNTESNAPIGGSVCSFVLLGAARVKCAQLAFDAVDTYFNKRAKSGSIPIRKFEDVLEQLGVDLSRTHGDDIDEQRSLADPDGTGILTLARFVQWYHDALCLGKIVEADDEELAEERQPTPTAASAPMTDAITDDFETNAKQLKDELEATVGIAGGALKGDRVAFFFTEGVMYGECLGPAPKPRDRERGFCKVG